MRARVGSVVRRKGRGNGESDVVGAHHLQRLARETCENSATRQLNAFGVIDCVGFFIRGGES